MVGTVILFRWRRSRLDAGAIFPMVLCKKLRWLLLTAILLAGLPVRAQYLYAMLQSTTNNALFSYSNGVRVAVIACDWDQFEPSRGSFNSSYIASVLAQKNYFESIGDAVQLDLGIQYPPSWVFSDTAGKFVNQFGQAFTSTSPGVNVPNAVFSQAVRNDLGAYITNVFLALGTDWQAVRIGGGMYNEINYPAASYSDSSGNHQNCYWGFDSAAQTGAGLAIGVSPCPVPGWIPGNASPNGEASQFVNWYLSSIGNYVNWQIQTVRNSGFGGPILALCGSWGVRPGWLQAAIAVNLGGASPDSADVAEGKDFQTIIAGITDTNVVVDCTWLDAPLNSFGDDAGGNQDNWSPVHYLWYCASTHTPSLRVWGENTGNATPNETPTNPLQRCFARMNSYKLMGVIWAFEGQLFDPPSDGYITFADFAAAISNNVNAVIVYNADPSGVVINGSWTLSDTDNGYWGDTYLDDGNSGKGSKTVAFTPTLPQRGDYRVYAWWPASANNATDTPMTVNYAGGSTTVYANQTQNGGQWVLLGTWNFDAGTNGSVIVSDAGTSGHVIANAVRFVEVTPSAPFVLETTSQSSGQIILKWSSIIGFAYQVQYENTVLGSNWHNIGPPITATAPVTSFTDDPGGITSRFYRIQGQ